MLEHHDGRAKPAALLLLSIVALGAALRVLLLGAEPLWADEAFSWAWAHLPYSAIWGDAARFDYSPPLFFSLQRLWLVFGDSEAAMRSLSTLFGILTIPLVFWLGQVTGGVGIGLLAALLAATSAPLVAYSQEARTYSFLCFVGMTAVLGLAFFLRTWATPQPWPARSGNRAGGLPRDRVFSLAAYMTGTTLALYVHNTAIFLPLLANLVALYWWLVHANRSWAFAGAWIAANLLPFLLWLWWAPTLLAQMANQTELQQFYEQPSPFLAAFQAIRLYSQLYVSKLKPLQIIVPIPLLALLGIWAWRDRPPVLVLLLAFAAGIPLTVYAIGLVLRPIWVGRVILWSIPFGMILIAAGIYAIRDRRLRALVLSIVLIAQAANLIGYYAIQRKEPMDRVARDIAASFEPGDAVVVYPFNAYHTYVYYARQAGAPGSQYILLRAPFPLDYPHVGDVEEPGRTFINNISELRVVAAKHRRLWVVARRLENYDPGGAVAASIETLGKVVNRRRYEPLLQLFLVHVS